jgi:nicotinamide-nucleotide amidase
MSDPAKLLVAEVLSIGDELIHGSNLDTNARWLANLLELHGASVQRFTVVGDDPVQLESAMRDACTRADLVIATGGLGPTLDDRTRDVVAAIAGGPLWFHAPSWQLVQDYLGARQRPVPASNRRQAEFPPGATVLHNPIGTAPGFRLRLLRAELFAFPGVPREMKRMAEDWLLPHLNSLPSQQPVAQVCLCVLGPSEALLGERIEPFMVAGREPAVGITASGGLLTIRIVGRGRDAAAAAAACEGTAVEIRPLLADWLVAEGTEALHVLLGRRLLAANVSVALAESCTGGLLAAKLTEVPGISAVFRGGVVAYANEAKTDLLGVGAALLQQHGAVSEPVAAAMAKGAAQRLRARLGVSVTGIAGPGGGTPEKPVGTVCFGVCLDGVVTTWTRHLPDLGREFLRERAAFELLAAIFRNVPLPAETGRGAT